MQPYIHKGKGYGRDDLDSEGEIYKTYYANSLVMDLS